MWPPKISLAAENTTVVVPFTAGGPADRVARDLAEALRKPLGGATVVIENVAGAGSFHRRRQGGPRQIPMATPCC